MNYPIGHCCEDCGVLTRPRARTRGLCLACRRYRQRHGPPAAGGVRLRRPYLTYPEGHQCRSCGVLTVSGRRAGGRCDPCARYWSHHQAERPRSALVAYPAGHCCSHCGLPTRPKRRAGGRCLACARYWRAWGQERPAATGPRPCGNCQRLVPRGHRWVQGRCGTCYGYYAVHGVERPAALLAGRRVVGPARPRPPRETAGRPPRPAPGWTWTGTGWTPPLSYCKGFLDFDRKPLCGQCGERTDCGETAAWRVQWQGKPARDGAA